MLKKRVVCAMLIGGMVIGSLLGCKKETSVEFRTAKSYDEIFEIVKNSTSKEEQLDPEFGVGYKMADSVGTSGSSSTNIRTSGVLEADVVQNDGTHLFALKESAMEISIVETQGNAMNVVGTIKAKSGAQISEFLIRDQMAYVFTNVNRTKKNEEAIEVFDRIDTEVCIYDLKDVSHPQLVREVSQSGFYCSSRMKEDHLYIFSELMISNEDAPEPFINEEKMQCENIYLPPTNRGCLYSIVTAVDLEGNLTDSKAVLTEGSLSYVSEEGIYFYENLEPLMIARKSDIDQRQTAIHKLKYENGKIQGSASCVVNGTIKDSFCIDEYEGYLRVVSNVTEEDDTYNEVRVFDESLKCVGELSDIAPGEEIHSARFFGETGYFVTFKEVDPLFSIDFSNPEKPQIIGELKIPGFSEYLHLYKEGMLLGIGLDIDGNDMIEGVKFSMFDISDPQNTEEIATYTIENTYYSEVFYQYKAALIEKNLIGIPTEGAEDSFYHVMGYDEEQRKFVLRMEEKMDEISSMGRRGARIGESLYVISGNEITMYDCEKFTRISSIKI